MNNFEPPPLEEVPLDAYENVVGIRWSAKASDQGTKPKQGVNTNCHVELTSASSIIPQPINWLWPGWIARGKLTVLAGAGGSGKTTLSIGLIGTLTSGGRWPDGTQCTAPGNVIIWSSEDDKDDTLVPRLMAAGADLHRVHFVTARLNAQGEREPFDPANDINLLNERLATIEGGVALLLIDPIVCAIKGDMHRANDVRRGLQAVVDFAEKNKCAVLGISHFSKGSIGGPPSERVIGSQAFSALARTVLVAAKQENSTTRVLAHAKSNISNDQGGVEYFIVPCTVGNDIETACVQWGEKIEGSARDILANAEKAENANSKDYEKRTALESACQFLQEALKGGPVDSEQIEQDAKNAGCSWASVKRAKNKLGVLARKKTEMNGGWYWMLHEDAQETAKMLTENNEHLQEEMSTFNDSPAYDDSDSEEI